MAIIRQRFGINTNERVQPLLDLTFIGFEVGDADMMLSGNVGMMRGPVLVFAFQGFMRGLDMGCECVGMVFFLPALPRVFFSL